MIQHENPPPGDTAALEIVCEAEISISLFTVKTED